MNSAARRAKPNSTKPRRGRPREFDADKALDRALRVFWRNGYEGTSLDDLTAATGINRPSLYAAFGNKEDLFRKVMDRYAAGPAAFLIEALNEPTARAAVERVLYGTAASVTSPDDPHGCLVVQGALCCGPEANRVRRELAARRAAFQGSLRTRLERANTEGELTAEADCDAVAAFIMAVCHGMAVQAAGGAKRADLERIAGLALQAWPGARNPRR